MINVKKGLVQVRGNKETIMAEIAVLVHTVVDVTKFLTKEDIDECLKLAYMTDEELSNAENKQKEREKAIVEFIDGLFAELKEGSK